MQYRVKNPTIPLLQELAMLSFNLRYWQKAFRKDLGVENKMMASEAESNLDKFIKENIEPIPGTEKEI